MEQKPLDRNTRVCEKFFLVPIFLLGYDKPVVNLQLKKCTISAPVQTVRHLQSRM